MDLSRRDSKDNTAKNLKQLTLNMTSRRSPAIARKHELLEQYKSRISLLFKHIDIDAIIPEHSFECVSLSLCSSSLIADDLCGQKIDPQISSSIRMLELPNKRHDMLQCTNASAGLPTRYLDSAYKKRQTVDGNFSGDFTKKKSASKYQPKFSSGSSSTSFTGTASSDTGTSITYGAISIDSETLPQYTSDYCSDKECYGTVPLLLSPDKRISQTQFVPPLTCSKRYQKPATVIIPDFIDFSAVDLSRGRLNSVETIGSTASSESQERYFQDECSKYAAKKELARSSSTGVSPTDSSNKSVGFVKLATLTYGKPVPKRGRHRAVSFSQMITEEQGGRRVCHNSHFAGCVAAPLASALPSPPVAWVAQKTSDKSIGQFLQSICSGRQRSREVGDVSITRKNHGNKSRKANSHQSKQSSRTKQLPKSKPRDDIQTKSTTKPRRQFDHSRNQKHRGYSKTEKAEIHDYKNDKTKIGILHKPDGSGDGPSSIPGNVMSFFEAFKQSSKK